MKRQDPQLDPSENGPADADASRAPLAPFAPPVRDAGVLALLKGLNPPEVPVPTETASTDGELSASFAAGPREAPSAQSTPAPEASVVVGPDRTPDGARKKKSKPPSPEQLSTTFRLRPSQQSLVVPVALAMLVGGGGAGLWIWGRTSAPTTIPAPIVVSVPTATVPVPSLPPVPPIAPAVTAAGSDPPADTARAQPAPAASASVPTAKPSKPAPTRRKEDEPDRVL
jgi:hypothetical protein